MVSQSSFSESSVSSLVSHQSFIQSVSCQSVRGSSFSPQSVARPLSQLFRCQAINSQLVSQVSLFCSDLVLFCPPRIPHPMPTSSRMTPTSVPTAPLSLYVRRNVIPFLISTKICLLLTCVPVVRLYFLLCVCTPCCASVLLVVHLQKLYSLSQESGRAAAKFFVNSCPKFFTTDFAEPHIPVRP